MPDASLRQQAEAIAALARWADGGPTPRISERRMLAENARRAEQTIRSLAGAVRAGGVLS